MRPVLLLSWISCCLSAKILLVPFDHKGHANLFGVTAQELQKRGHEVLVLGSERHEAMFQKMKIPHLINRSKKSVAPMEDDTKINSVLFESGFHQVLNAMSFMKAAATTTKIFCYEVFANSEMMKQLQDANFDIAIIDGVDVGRCFYIFPYKLNIPWITLSARHDPWLARLPTMPSMEGQFGMMQFSSEPTFLERVGNLLMHVMLYTMSPPSPISDSEIADLAPEKPQTTYKKLFQRSEVFLINADNTCMDYPRISGPHYHFIGGAAAHPIQPLSSEFETFVNTADHGLIVVSFGSLVKRAPDDLMRKMMDAFRRIPQKVVMRYEGTFEGVPNNVLLSKWLPQNDLLGHEKTVLYIAHGGNNGQTEGHYHGVPMVVIPFLGDQMYAAKRVEIKNYGKYINYQDFTSDQLYQYIVEITSNPIYKNNINKCSEIIKSLPSAHEQVDFWVRHVLKFSGDHLKPQFMDMPLHKFFMLDVLLFLLCIVLLLVFAFVKLAKCCRRCLCKSKAKQE